MSALHYELYDQDGTLTPMTCADTASNRLFVEYIAKHDRHPHPKQIREGQPA